MLPPPNLHYVHILPSPTLSVSSFLLSLLSSHAVNHTSQATPPSAFQLSPWLLPAYCTTPKSCVMYPALV
ncbi:hypothetical protein XELAEV_18017730mg [Xenopus laevis]|uniref:Uncharacterized protein n=1 Tax=Xenopus laevis TaxID=8355 RepID=A0A974DDS2_XENLA|nr:hypothetical protein XELAEV_18017730mg [Xenopus laevis]